MRRCVLAAFALAALVVVAAGAEQQPFRVEEWETEDAAAAGLQKAVEGGLALTKSSGRSLISDAMNRGWWGLAELLVDVGRDASVDLSSTVYQSAAVIRRKLQALTEAMGKRAVSTGIAPAFEWAQSPDSVFLNVKFAHKWDTPATLGCVEDTVSMEEGRLLFEVHCKAKRKKFVLDLGLHGTIAPDNSTWSMGAVGRATFTLKKAQRASWPRLLQAAKKPGNMHVWWSLHEKYESDNDKLEDEEKAELRRVKKEAKAKQAADAAAGGATPTQSPSATPSPTPVPTLSEVDKQAQEVEAEAAKKRKVADARHKEVLAALDTEARQRKRAIDDRAADDKKRVESDIAKKRTEAEAKLAEEKAEIQRLTAEAVKQLGHGGEL